MKRWKILGTALSLGLLASGAGFKLRSQSPSEAPTGFMTPTLSENPGSQSVSNGMTEPMGDTFGGDQATFEEEEGVDKGLGPVYNARACVDCHQNP